MSEKLGVSVVPDDNFTLTWAQDNDLPSQLEAINKIAETAAKEFSIKASLDRMQEAWECVELAILDYRDTGTCILTDVDTYIALLDEQVTLTQAMTFSAFKGEETNERRRIRRDMNRCQIVFFPVEISLNQITHETIERSNEKTQKNTHKKKKQVRTAIASTRGTKRCRTRVR